MSNASISTHVLDTSRGLPAEGVGIVLERDVEGRFQELGRGRTDADGRLRTLLGTHPLELGVYRLTFATQAYFDGEGTACFYPEVVVVFSIQDAARHHHVPLLISPFGFSTYRGS